MRVVLKNGDIRKSEGEMKDWQHLVATETMSCCYGKLFLPLILCQHWDSTVYWICV